MSPEIVPNRRMRVLVCGGRDFENREPLWDALYRLEPAVVIEGGARGADRLAAEWAKHTGTILRTYPARWLEEGRAAGVLRNQRMLDDGRPDLVLACPGGRGTADMVRRARTAGITIQHLVPVAAQGMPPEGPKRECGSGASAPASPVRQDAPKHSPTTPQETINE